MLLQQRPELRPNYRHFRTDLKYNLFSLLQALDAGLLSEPELVSGNPMGTAADEVAFFPGCSLNSYSPELTQLAFDWLREQGIASRKLNFCCGATFLDTGFFEEFEAFKHKAAAYIQGLGIKKLVIVCPHCGYELPQLLEGTDVELLLLPELMAQAGVRVPGSGSYSMHDACYDRYDGRYAAAVKTMFEGWELRTLEHSGRHTICCGGGGMVSAYAPAYCEYRRNQRLAEVDAVSSDVMISTCFSCVNSLQRGEASKPVRHYLELVFGYETDWDEVYGRVNHMYSLPEAMELLAGEDPLF
ncbi:MAG: heterodisulfide reductase-related iron-sulfur binding cluster [Coriobacteriales bacterium]